MWQVKVNFTDVKISQMENFIARGDRRIGQVMRRAWEMGTSNDTWWMDPATAHASWTRAIEEVGLSWSYRRLEEGEWDVLERLGDARYRKQGGGGKGRIDRGDLKDDRLDADLPWDHIDSGMSKTWLKTDLQRALEAAVVPDCSYNACSECGVCDEGENFGANVVHEPPPIPEFEGHYRPNTHKAQRLRFRYAKGGDMVFVGHLDLMTLFDRACRRAGLPVTADTSPFNARPQILPASALPLGATSSAELIEVMLTEVLDPESARLRLQEQLPPGMRLISVEEVPVYRVDGRPTEKITTSLQSMTQLVAIRVRLLWKRQLPRLILG